MKLLITAATAAEIQPLQEFLSQNYKKTGVNRFQKGFTSDVQLLVTGVGMPLTAFHLGHTVPAISPDWIIQAGVAGTYKENLELGTVVNVATEQFGDLGAQDADGSFLDVFQLGLLPFQEHPWNQGRLVNPYAEQAHFLPKVAGLTVNKVNGYGPAIEAVRLKYAPDIETMEGAAFFYACLHLGYPFMEIRSISNLVEPRNRAAWQMGKAIRNLNQTLIDMLEVWLGS